MEIINITHPGQSPIDGDWVEYHYDSGAIERKTYFEPSAPPPIPPDPCEWLIDIGPFFDRFGASKMAILTSADAVVKAIIQDVQIRKWIDLKRVDVEQALDALISKSVIDSAQKATILTTPVNIEENRALRKLYF